MKTRKYSIWNHYCYLYRELWKSNPISFLMIFLEVLTNVLRPLVTVWLPAFIVGLLEDQCSVGELVLACILVYIGVAVLCGGNVIVNNRGWIYYMVLRLETMMTKVLKKSMEVDYRIYEQEQTQNAMQKAKSSLYGESAGPGEFFRWTTSLVIGVCGLVLYSVLIAQLHPLIVLLLLVMSAIQYLIHNMAKSYDKKHRDEQAVHGRYQEYLFGQSTDVKSGKDVRLYQLQKWLIPLYEKHNREYQKQLGKNQTMYFIYDLAGLLLAFFRDGICYLYLMYLLTQGMDVSDFVLYMGVVGGYGSWFSKIGETAARISQSLIGVEDYRRYVEEEAPDAEDKKVLCLQEQESFDIEFDHVSFCYPGSDNMVLKDVSFHIQSGEKIALVGINGAGKTTIVKMLCGFYVPTQGKIIINGVDVTQLDCEKYRELVSVLFQDSVLLSYTIAQNVTGQSDENQDRDRLWLALEQCGLADKVRSLPKREDSFIGKALDKEGIQLSGGQVQKLFLARALYKQAHMLILDEPTAALDALAESEMYEQYAKLVEKKTSVYISHRLSSTRFCDRIFFLEDGAIKEVGTHEELIKLDGSYAEMFRVQSQYYVEEEEGGAEDEA